MARALWRGLLAVLLLSSLCSVPVLAASLSVNANLDSDTLAPGAEAVVRGTVMDGMSSVQGATVTVTVIGTDISANATTSLMGLYAVFFYAPSTDGEYMVNVSAQKGSDTGYAIPMLTLKVETPPVPDISLSAEDITFWPEDPATNTKVLVNATVRNIGDADANTTVRIFLGEPFDGKLLHEENITVPAGGSVNVSEMWPAESGLQLFTVAAYNVQPTDSDFTNNQANKTLEVEDIRPPDISELSINPAEPTSRDVISVLAHVEDDLALAEEEPVVLVYFVGEGEEEEMPMNLTAHGFLWELGPFPGGTYVSVKVRATDAANNTAETVWHRVDIFHSNITVHVGNLTATAGHNISIACSAEYEDKTPVAGHQALLVLDGVSHHALTDGNGEAVFNLTAPEIPGKYDFTVFVNDKRLEANASAVLTVLRPTHPDVMIVQGGIAFSWSDPSEVEVTVILYNGGDAPGEVHLEVFLGSPSKGVLLNESRFTMEPGQFLFHTFVWSPQPGHHAIVVVADCPGDIDPGNNIATAEVTIPAPDKNPGGDIGDGAGDDDPQDDVLETVSWTPGQILISLALGLLLSLLAYAILVRLIERGKKE